MDRVHLVDRRTEVLLTPHTDLLRPPRFELLRGLSLLGLDAFKDHGRRICKLAH